MIIYTPYRLVVISYLWKQYSVVFGELKSVEESKVMQNNMH